MPLDAAQWQIQITAADKTSAAFTSLQQRMKQTETIAAGMSQGMSNAFGAVTRMLGPLTAATLAAAAAHKLWTAGMAAGDLGEQAEQIGLTTDQLQAYRLVAAQSGVNVEQLDGAMMKLTRAMGTANEGSDEMIARFDKLGVKLLDSEGKLRKPAEVLPELARGLLGMSSETERNALIMEIFGRSGSRMVTTLEQLARGNDAVIQSAREAGAVISGETIKAWDDLSDQLKVAEQRSQSLWAELGKPIAIEGLKLFNATLKETHAIMSAIDKAGNWLFGGGLTGTDLAGLQKRAETLQATINAISEGAQGQVDDLARARLAGLYKQLEDVNDQIAQKMTAGYVLPAVTVTASTGTSNPVGKAAKGAGDSAQKKLDALIVERTALEDALSKFETQGNETVAEMEKRLDRQVALQKKVNSLTEGLPKDSPLAQQMTAEATAITELNTKLEEKRRIMQGAEQTVAKYGDGMKAAERATADLNEQLALGLINPQQYALAIRDVARAQEEQAIQTRGAIGGLDGFFAGMENATRQANKMSREFQYGEKMIGLMDEAISEMVQNGEVNFQRLLQSFVTMLIQMEMRAAASSLFSAIGGSMGAGGGLISGIVSGIAGMFGSGGSSGVGGLISSGMLSGTGGTYAEGGRPPLNKVSLVGERGPELFVPDTAGTIIPNHALDGGGGEVVSVNMQNSFGGGVTHAEMLRYGAMIEERAKAGAMAGIEAKRKRGGSIKQVFRG